MADHRRHGVVVVRLRVVAVALADLVDRIDVVALTEAVEIGGPVEGAVGGVRRAEIAAMEQHHHRPRTLFVVARVDSVCVDEFPLVHRHGGGPPLVRFP